MLIKSILGFHYQAINSSLKLLIKRPFVSLITIMILSVTLLLPAFFWALSINFKKINYNWQKEKTIYLFLKPGIPPKEEKNFFAQIEKVNGVASASFKNANEALLELRQEPGMQNIMHYLEENPLPSVITVFPKEMNTQDLEILYKNLKSYPQVEESLIDLDWVKKLQAIFNLLNHIKQVLTFILALAVILIIGNTMRTIVLSRAAEIKVLKLIGAKTSFILRPYVYTGMFYGVLAGILALIFLHICLFILSLSIEELTSIYGLEYSIVSLNFVDSLILLLTAVGLGWLGAWLAVRKQISSIEPA